MRLNRLQTITVILIALLGAGLAALSFIGQLAIILLLSVIMAAFWCAIVVFGKPDLHLAFFIVFLAMLGIAILDQLPFVWLALLVILDIAAWNLGEFSQRALRYKHIPNQKRMENLHMKQLAVPLGIGFALAMLPSLIRVELPFVVMAVLVVGAVVL
ncbi:MAG: hypothetical protein V2J07_07785, partial [Anaerolineae bacterium]|nr:hypothetical protein [Anaerolineae bacterium]